MTSAIRKLDTRDAQFIDRKRWKPADTSTTGTNAGTSGTSTSGTTRKPITLQHPADARTRFTAESGAGYRAHVVARF